MEFEKKGIRFFLALPDVISLLNLSFGFLAILVAFNGNVNLSSVLIIISIVFDSIDGWVARKIGRNDEYDFGKNIDSLSDVVSFGIAPGVLLYSIGNSHPPEISLFVPIVSLFMVICGVLRLTRFNVICNKVDYDGFIGLPIPTIAILLSTFVLSGFFNIYICLVLMIVTGLLMISNVKYPKFDNIKIISFGALLILLIIIFYLLNLAGLNIFATILFALTVIYVVINFIKALN
ncbi:MAG: archaetidylserine synthase [Methanobacteriaceae archaeon]|jgi:archaetidylserine synthase|nr:archaetidylserine synthase [Candidatus Methanorudis spinitermitis]